MIDGRNVSLVTVEESHLPCIYEILMKDDIGSTFSTTYKELSLQGLASFLYMTEPGTTAKAFTIMLKEKIIGFVTLNNIHSIRHNAYIGIVGIDTEYQNGMHGSDALKTLIKYAFNTLNLHRLYGHTYSDNKKMNTIYKRGKWTHEGTEREYAYKDGEWIDREIWGILKKDFKEV